MWMSGRSGIRTAIPVPPFKLCVSNVTVTSSRMLFGVQRPFKAPGKDEFTCTWPFRDDGIAPDEASTVRCCVSGPRAPAAAARPPSRTAVLIDCTWRKARPNPMMPNTSMNRRGARRAISTADAPSSRRIRALTALSTEPLRVDRLEGFVERDRVGLGPLLDRLVVDAGAVDQIE